MEFLSSQVKLLKMHFLGTTKLLSSMTECNIYWTKSVTSTQEIKVAWINWEPHTQTSNPTDLLLTRAILNHSSKSCVIFWWLCCSSFPFLFQWAAIKSKLISGEIFRGTKLPTAISATREVFWFEIQMVFAVSFPPKCIFVVLGIPMKSTKMMHLFSSTQLWLGQYSFSSTPETTSCSFLRKNSCQNWTHPAWTRICY